MISVVIPLYNKSGHIRKTIDSVLGQSYGDFEIIVVDDGSTDGSADIVKCIDDDRIHLICQTNAGVSSARNKGIDESKGDFVALLDSDDLWKPEFLETLHNLSVKYPECDVFATDYEEHLCDGRISFTKINKLPFSGTDGILTNYFEVASHSSPPICSISLMVRKGVFESVGGFPLGIKSGEDLLTWARLACRYKIAYSKKRLAIYNLGEGYDYSNLPPRRQDIGDPVGGELKSLMKDFPDATGLKAYISLWHKMRASVAIRYGERMETLREIGKSLYYDPSNIKALKFAPLALIPHSLRKKIISLKK